MKDPSDDIRDWIYTTLNGHVTYAGANVPVYSFPPENVSYPYIVLGEQSAEGEEGTKDHWLWDVANAIHIYTRHTGHDASYIPVNSISSTVMQLLRTYTTGDNYATDESPVMLTNFDLIRVRVGTFSTDRILNDNEIIISKQLSINLLVEES